MPTTTKETPTYEPLHDDGGYICGIVAHGDVDEQTMRDLHYSHTGDRLQNAKCYRGYFRWIPTLNETCPRMLYNAEPGPGAFYGTIIDARRQ